MLRFDSSASDKSDDLYHVAITKRLVIACAAREFSVDFDGYLVGPELQFAQQGVQRAVIVQLFLLAINGDMNHLMNEYIPRGATEKSG